MRRENLNLQHIIDLEKWQELQDSLARVTKMSIITVDYKGTPVSGHSLCTSFCSGVRQDPELASHCRKCDARGGLEAVRQNRPYIYLCHLNIVDIAIPIVVDDHYVGAIMAGQVKLKHRKNEDQLEQILAFPSDLRSRGVSRKLHRVYADLPSLSLGEVQDIAAMLHKLCNYIIEEALNKSLMFEIYEKTISGEQRPDLASTLANYKSENIESVQTEISNALANYHVKEAAENNLVKVNPVLQPALDYILSHKSENVGLNQASNLCGLSAGYFSRQFRKETGKTYSVFLSLLKIEWAKQMLESTNLTVLQISQELGFRESGYFIKTFRKYEGLTPLGYRKSFGRNAL